MGKAAVSHRSLPIGLCQNGVHTSMKKQIIGVMLASALCGGLLASAKPAAAWWTRSYGGSLYSTKSGERVYGDAAEYPVLSTSSMSMANANQIYVEGYHYRGDVRTSAQVCAADWAGGSETCSPSLTNTGSGHKTWAFGGDYGYIWDNAADFPYVYVYSYNTGGVAAENVRVTGIFIAN